jgi:hypothetical protein
MSLGVFGTSAERCGLTRVQRKVFAPHSSGLRLLDQLAEPRARPYG